MRASKLRLAAALPVGVASAPLGHLLAYEARFGPSAARAESSGAHEYFPVLAGTLSAGLGVALLASLLVLAAARMVAGQRRGARAAGRPQGLFSLLAVLFTVQLGVFIVQEAAEALFTGSQMTPLAEMLLCGTFGQLPVAAVAALALSWLSVQLEVAIRTLRVLVGRFELRHEVVCRLWTPAWVDDPLRNSALSAFANRGPPAPLLDTAIA